jgi:hypothetical protein
VRTRPGRSTRASRPRCSFCAVLKQKDFEFIAHDLEKVNRITYWSSVVVIAVFLINSVCSAGMIINSYYDGFRTITVLLSNCGLIIHLLKKVLGHADIAIERQLALSAYLSKPVSFNRIDPHYVPVGHPSTTMLHPGVGHAHGNTGAAAASAAIHVHAAASPSV